MGGWRRDGEMGPGGRRRQAVTTLLTEERLIKRNRRSHRLRLALCWNIMPPTAMFRFRMDGRFARECDTSWRLDMYVPAVGHLGVEV